MAKMAARWGAGEETLTACHADFFPMDTLDETVGLSSGETLEALQSCLDPSILSMFEDTPTVETKGLDEENEATLLTALTEILDNVDDENLSPFDTLPDSDLLSGQKGREHSPLRRLLCLPRCPPEKDTQCGERPISAGKSLPRMQLDCVQRSDGEEEDESSFTLSPVRHDLSPDSDLLDWEGQALPLPITFDHDGEDGVSVSLGDLVRHMHPYCMAICLENDDREQILPEGGILLEVVDQGENGEPILAIPDMNLPVPLPLQEQISESEQRDADEVASDSSEHIVVDDEGVTVSDAPVKVTAPATPHDCSDVKDEMTVNRKKEEFREKCPSRRKRKKKCKEPCQSKPVEGRVLRSGTVRKMAEEATKKSEQRSFKEKKHNIPKIPPPSAAVIPKKLNPRQTETRTETTTATLLPEMSMKVPTNVSQDSHLLKATPEVSQPLCSSSAVCSQQPDQTLKRPGPAPETVEDSSAAPPAVLAPLPTEGTVAAPSPQTPQITPPVNEALPPVSIPAQEPKPKSLSLAEYRRLRQQKKPAPVEKRDNTTTKWPSLPEPPKELPPIPCLPDPSPKDPRRPNPHTLKKEVEEVRPAWQPRGPAAPPTPEALLVPPAYMTASSSKVSAATSKPQQTPETSKPALPKKPTAPVSKSESDLDKRQHITVQPAVPCVPQSARAPASLKQAVQFTSSADEKCSLVQSGGNGVDKRSQPQPISPNSAELTESCPKITTEPIKPSTATHSVPQKTTLFKKVPDITAATTLNIAADCEYSKPTASGPQCFFSSAAQPPESQSLKEEPVVLETKEGPAASVKPQKARSPTQELIEAFTNEIGIEAADLTSLLEQFEENQAKEEHCLPEVSGRAAAVGNSSFELAPEKTVLERVRASDLSNTAALTPPATPPHQMWKPLAPVALLGKSRAVEASKLSPSKVIQIDARPLPSIKSRSKPTPAAATVDHNLACMDHDYCLPNKGTSIEEPGRRWNVKQQSFITIKPIKQPTTTTTRTNLAVLHSSVTSTSKPVITTKTRVFPPTDGLDQSSLLETPDSSPARQETEPSDKIGSPRRGHFRRAYCRHAASRSPSPRSSPKERRTGGRSRKRRLPHSPSPVSSSSESDSHSSRSRSRSNAPSKKRYRPRHSESSSSSSSRCSSRSSSRSSPSGSRSPPRRRRCSYSSSHSASGSRSRSHSRSPQRRAQWSRSTAWYSATYTPDYSHSTSTNVEQVKRRKEKAIEQRRVVYVGRIRGTMTQKELRERFSLFGEIEECTLHFRDHGDNYGFVTYYDTKDAFMAIENGSRLRKPDELPFDLCFGGRRQFCQTSYADLDSSREFEPLPVKDKFHALDFDTLLRQAQQNLKR